MKQRSKSRRKWHFCIDRYNRRYNTFGTQRRKVMQQSIIISRDIYFKKSREIMKLMFTLT